MPIDKNLPEEIKKLSFEEAMDELEEIVRALEEGDADLDKAIDAYARGAVLKLHCEKKLNDAKSRIDKIALDDNGTPRAESFDVE